ncbi:hypothetical protein O6H91_02G043000 [Diphasiastrum complanatum]|uniref:Uncharacterized protein n=1 Tax=Diphasiastrum complanatum TaxID=34168 RepID=A0ACC2EET7_DIPCM|nr:hypothetical protein O6H91_02G043000 [Diphasiastrum complanatum]
MNGIGGGLDGIFEIEGANAVFVAPPQVLSKSYLHYSVDASLYYARSVLLDAVASTQAPSKEAEDDERKRKRKRKNKKRVYELNEKEALAELRHQEARSCILNAHEAFRLSSRLLEFRRNCKNKTKIILSCEECHLTTISQDRDIELDFVKLAGVWQAPLYKLTLPSKVEENVVHEVGEEMQNYSLFNMWIENKRSEEVIGKVTGFNFLLPKKCRFFISDIAQIRRLIPDSSSNGYNLLVIDPPWENKSVSRRALYPTLPNKQLLRIPLKSLVHLDGALVALWLTNRQKLHQFVEQELFPTWGVKLITTWYWLKLTTEGELISSLDLTHHKPYECLLIGYALQKLPEETFAMREDGLKPFIRNVPAGLVALSVPGDHSRKPPLGLLLSQCAPHGSRSVSCLELFARELHPGWDSWGNEPLYFQNMKFFRKEISTK